MTEKPDNGDIVAQQAVPILPDDTALQVFQKVTVAAEMALNGVLPALLAGKARPEKQDLSKGAVLWRAQGGRWHHRLVAIGDRDTQSGARSGTALPGRDDANHGQADAHPADAGEQRRCGRRIAPAFYVREGKAFAICGDGMLRVVRFELDGIEMSAAEFAAKYGTEKFEFNC